MSKAQTRRVVEKLDALTGDDPEKAHATADALLLGIVPQEVADAYTRLVGRCPWWATA